MANDWEPPDTLSLSLLAFMFMPPYAVLYCALMTSCLDYNSSISKSSLPILYTLWFSSAIPSSMLVYLLLA